MSKSQMEFASQYDAALFLSSDEVALKGRRKPYIHSRCISEDRKHFHCVPIVSTDISTTSPVKPTHRRTWSPIYTILLSPRSKARKYRQQRIDADDFAGHEGKEEDEASPDSDCLAEVVEPLLEVDEDEPPTYHDIIFEDDRGVGAISREPSRSSKKRGDSPGGEIEESSPRSLAENLEASTKHLDGRLPTTSAPLFLLVDNENDARREFAGDVAKSISQQVDQPEISMRAKSSATMCSAEWQESWERGKLEILKRLRVMQETGDRRRSFCRRII